VLTSDLDATDASSYTTASISPAPNRVLLVFTQSVMATAVLAPTVTVSGLGLTWTQRADRLYASADNVGAEPNRLNLFTAPTGASPGSGALTLTMSSLASGAGWVVIELDRADNGSPVVQAPTAWSSAAETSGSVTLAGAGASGNRAFACFGHREWEPSTERANWTELTDRKQTNPSTNMQTQWRPDAFETTASATWATARVWGGIAVEIRAAA